MRLGLATREYHPDMDRGGIGAYTWHLASGLRQCGHRVTILGGTSAPGVLKRRKRLAQWSGGLPKTSTRMLLYSVALARRVRQCASREPLEMLEAPDWGAEGFVLAARKVLPFAVRLHTPAFVVHRFDDGPTGVDRLLVNWLEKKTIVEADLITSPSLSLARIVAQRYQIPLERIHLLRYPLDTDLFTPGPRPHHARQTVLFVGRLNRRKGVHVLARAIPLVAHACPQVDFCFVGPDMPIGRTGSTTKQALFRILSEHSVNDRVRFLPPQARTRIVEHFRASDVCVVPSLYDNLPFACLEAMACAKAVVASAVGGLSEIIQTGVNGMLVPPDAPELLAEALIGLLQSKRRQEEIGGCARAYVEQHLNCASIAEATVQLYRTTTPLG